MRNLVSYSFHKEELKGYTKYHYSAHNVPCACASPLGLRDLGVGPSSENLVRQEERSRECSDVRPSSYSGYPLSVIYLTETDQLSSIYYHCVTGANT